MKQIFTIGHSNHEVAAFLQILSNNFVQVVVDVRSSPYSKYVPQFNKREVENIFAEAGFKYIFMGDAIGGKPTDPEFVDDSGKAIYEKIARSDKFQEGIIRLQNGLRAGWSIVLMCAEENPLKCHRHLMIAKELEFNQKIPVWHIRADGSHTRAKEHLNKHPEQLMLF